MHQGAVRDPKVRENNKLDPVYLILHEATHLSWREGETEGGRVRQRERYTDRKRCTDRGRYTKGEIHRGREERYRGRDTQTEGERRDTEGEIHRGRGEIQREGEGRQWERHRERGR